jgi:hypothetical protein
MTNNSWYEGVAADAPLTQGDLLENFPLVGWKSEVIQVEQDKNLGESLRGATEIVQANVVVMTQACDLEHERVANVILCPFESLAEHFSLWKEAMQAGNQNPSKKAWRRYCDDIRDGFVWNMTVLDAGESGELSTPHLVVDFREIFTLPRKKGQAFCQMGHSHRSSSTAPAAFPFGNPPRPAPIQIAPPDAAERTARRSPDLSGRGLFRRPGGRI